MARAETEMLRGVPVLHLPRPPMPEQTINLADGSGVSTLELGEAQEVALAAITLPIGEAPPIAAFKKAPRQLTSFSPFLYELPDRPNSRAQKPLRGWECKSAKEEREIPLVAISRLAVTALSPWQAFRRTECRSMTSLIGGRTTAISGILSTLGR